MAATDFWDEDTQVRDLDAAPEADPVFEVIWTDEGGELVLRVTPLQKRPPEER
jgi:hypothetical protein